jgi:hypothetical protein
MKLYQVLETPTVLATDECSEPHLTKEFDTIAEAVHYMQDYHGSSKLTLLKVVTWHVNITDITEARDEPTN